MSKRTKRFGFREGLPRGAALVGIGVRDRLDGDVVDAGFEVPERQPDGMTPDDVALLW